MNKKFLKYALSLCCLLPASLTLTACDNHTHTFTENPADAFLKSEATCKDKAVYYKSCACGQKSTETFTSGQPLGHAYEYNSLGDGTHEKFCHNDPFDVVIEKCSSRDSASCSEPTFCEYCFGLASEPGEHNFTKQVATNEYLKQKATCTTKAQYYYSCECGEPGEEWFVYGEILGHEFTNYVSDNNATCEQDGTKTATCSRSGCNQKDVITDVGSALNHNYTGEWTHAGNDTHSKTCANNSAHKIYENCSGGTATCSKKAVCEICDTEYGNKLPHSYKDKVCENCGANQPSEGLAFVLSSDGKYYKVAGLGTCEDVNIVIPEEYNHLPVTHIENYAFQDSLIESIEIPNSVTYIGGLVFDGCANLTTVTMGGNVTYIGLDSFQDCSNITRINFGGTIDDWVQIDFTGPYTNPLYYGADLYINNELVTEANITTATKVSKYAFNGYTKLTSVTVGDNATLIGKSAFNGCTGLLSVELGENVTSIDYYAFQKCENLSSIKIGKKIEYIGNGAFSQCGSLRSVNYTGLINDWAQITFGDIEANPISGAFYINNVLVTEVNLNTATLVNSFAFKDCTSITNVIIGNGVETIKTHAFNGCKNLQSVIIGDNVASIESNAFSKCKKLTSVEIPSNVKTLAMEAFAYCSDLATITINSGVQSIGYAAFTGTAVVTIAIPDSVTTLQALAFDGCKSLTTVTTGNGIEDICESTFRGCSSLTNVTIGNSVSQIGHNAFANCTKLENIRLPESMFYVGTTAFDNCSSLKNVTIAESKELSLQSDTFNNCNAIEKIYYEGDINGWVQIYGLEGITGLYEDYPNRKIYIKGQLLTEANITTATTINGYAFKGCTTLTSVTIGNSVEAVGDYAFENCSNLTSVTIGNGVTNIGKDAFYHCLNLSTLTLGNKVETIGESAFYSCHGLTSVTIPNSVKTIGDYAFGYCTSLESLTLGNKVETIGTYAFDCSKITTLVIPDSVKTIGSHTFAGSNNLISVTIGSGVTSIGSEAFSGCNKLVEVINTSDLNIAKGATSYGYVGYYALNVKNSGTSDIVAVGDYSFFTVDGVNYLVAYDGNNIHLTLPANYNGQSYKIYKYAFQSNKNLVSVNFGSGVTSVGESAFEYCYNLTSVTIGQSVTSIDSSAFYLCRKLVEVINLSDLDIQKGSNENGYVAHYALKLKTTGTSEIVTVNDYLFYTLDGENYLLGYVGTSTELTLPANYNGQTYKIHDSAFINFETLTSVTLNSSVTSIGELAFASCTGLTNIMIPDSVEIVKDGAFDFCDNLKYNEYENGLYLGNANNPYLWLIGAKSNEITTCIIKDGCKIIPGNSFDWCEELTTITIPKTVTVIGNFAFFACNKLTTVFFKGTASEWESINMDINYNTELKYKICYYSETEPTTAGKYWHYVDGVETIWTTQA